MTSEIANPFVYDPVVLITGGIIAIIVGAIILWHLWIMAVSIVRQRLSIRRLNKRLRESQR